MVCLRDGCVSVCICSELQAGLAIKKVTCERAASYIQIIHAILQMPSSEGRRKAFFTCIAHLVVVTLFYCTTGLIHLKPKSRLLVKSRKLVALSYTVVTPMLNPIIYSLRNKEEEAQEKEQICRAERHCAKQLGKLVYNNRCSLHQRKELWLRQQTSPSYAEGASPISKRFVLRRSHAILFSRISSIFQQEDSFPLLLYEANRSVEEVIDSPQTSSWKTFSSWSCNLSGT
ncbi:Olfactory receptor 10A7 [Anas platyrhynchos]|uniref:Olfactory receptor 10A7 n=1 Tax=Anas platyrhynchos TaxID=8839 RepID=R0JZH5_ANAPL|nr:Olfactory receptor 10A7 [Anas platyrhynchos]